MPGNACERIRWMIQRARVGAAVEIIKGQCEAPEDYFGHRKRGCEATSIPSAPAKNIGIANAMPMFFLILLFCAILLRLVFGTPCENRTHN